MNTLLVAVLAVLAVASAKPYGATLVGPGTHGAVIQGPSAHGSAIGPDGSHTGGAAHGGAVVAPALPGGVVSGAVAPGHIGLGHVGVVAPIAPVVGHGLGLGLGVGHGLGLGVGHGLGLGLGHGLGVVGVAGDGHEGQYVPSGLELLHDDGSYRPEHHYAGHGVHGIWH